MTKKKMKMNRYTRYKKIKRIYDDEILLVQEGGKYYTFNGDAQRLSSCCGVDFDTVKGVKDIYCVASFDDELINGYMPKIIRNGYKLVIENER